MIRRFLQLFSSIHTAWLLRVVYIEVGMVALVHV